jgi:choice-of-anchor B domain-containing protein
LAGAACGDASSPASEASTSSSGTASTSTSSTPDPVTVTQPTPEDTSGASPDTTLATDDTSSASSSGPLSPDVHVVTEPAIEPCGALDPRPPANYSITGERYGDVWGFESGGREYAALGHTFGLSIIDVTDTVLVEVGHLEIAGYVPGRAVTGLGNLVYVGGQGPEQAFLRIVDVSNPAQPVLVDERTEYTQEIHTIGVVDGTLYLNNGFGACRFLDLGVPAAPTEIGGYYGNDCHDIVAVGDRLFVGGGYTSHWDVVDITNKTTPMVLGVTAVEKGIYAHSGALDITGKYFFGFDEFHIHDMLVYDVSNPGAPALVTTFQIGLEIPHNGYIRGNYLYVAWYEAGFVLVDVHDPSAPFEALRYATWPDPPISEWNGALNVDLGLPSGKVLVTDSLTGLHVLCIETPV